jgi:hypothetical protein
MIFSSKSARCLLLLAIGLGGAGAGFGCAASPEKFDSPDAAVDSFVSALRNHETAKLKEIFGPDSGEIVSSGDPVADRAEGDRFVATYDEQHRLTRDGEGRSTLIVGKSDWPFPVPIIKSNGGYVFDTDAGKDEILNRRIGRNELSTQEVCLAIVDAQRDYVRMHPQGGDLPVYASKVVSDPGTKNGLYWPTQEGEPPSPLGELVAEASAEGYTPRKDANQPPPAFHGYRYKLLTSQGSSAPGGAADYTVDGKLVGGFGVVAWPANYGNSGIMTFITNHDGVVYERDLGPDTDKIAAAMTQFNPEAGWTKSTDAAEAPSSAAAAD